MSTEPHNQKTGGQERILRNTSYLTGAFIIQKVLSFLYFIFIAKALGAYDLGLYDPAKAFIPILLILIDFSLSPVLTRELARRPEKAFVYLTNTLAVKAILAVVLLVLFGIITNFSQFGEIERSVIYLIALVVAFDSFTATFFAVFRGLQNMQYEAIGMILTQLLTIAVGLLALHYGYGIRGLFLATLSGSIINFFYALFVLKKRLGAYPSFSWDKEVIKSFLKMALPFALSAILAKVLTYTDRFILFLGVGRTEVGFYATAHKLTFALEFLPASFAAAFYPAMSKYFIEDKKRLASTFEHALLYLILIAVPITIGSVFLAHQIFHTLWAGDYLNSVIPFQIMISSILVIFLNFPVGTLLNATNNQKINTVNMAITVLVNIVLNLLLVERFAHVGSAIATAVSMVILFSLGIIRVNKIIEYKRVFLFKKLLFSILTAVVAIGIVATFKSAVTLYVSLPAFIIFYVIGILIFKVMSKDDFTILLNAFRRKRT